MEDKKKDEMMKGEMKQAVVTPSTSPGASSAFSTPPAKRARIQSKTPSERASPLYTPRFDEAFDASSTPCPQHVGGQDAIPTTTMTMTTTTTTTMMMMMMMARGGMRP